jgi:TatD DNase family protein
MSTTSARSNAKSEPTVVLPSGQARHPVIDIGINLTSDKFHKDTDAVVARAHEAGLTHLILTGTSVKASRDALQLCKRFASAKNVPTMRCTIGVHPHDAKTWSASVDAHLRELLSQNPGLVVAVGECGLDYNRMFSPEAEQVAAFEAQIRIAVDLQLPLFLHQRDAHDAFLAILQKHREALKDLPIVVHCFTGTLEECQAYLAFSPHCYIGLTGFICDDREGRGLHLDKVCQAIPADRLLIETDGPYVLPRNIPRPVQRQIVLGGRCEPCMIVWVLQRLAQHRGITTDEGVAELAKQIHANTLRVFFKPTAKDDALVVTKEKESQDQ